MDSLPFQGHGHGHIEPRHGDRTLEGLTGTAESKETPDTALMDDPSTRPRPRTIQLDDSGEVIPRIGARVAARGIGCPALPSSITLVERLLLQEAVSANCHTRKSLSEANASSIAETTRQQDRFQKFLSPSKAHGPTDAASLDLHLYNRTEP